MNKKVQKRILKSAGELSLDYRIAILSRYVSLMTTWFNDSDLSERKKMDEQAEELANLSEHWVKCADGLRHDEHTIIKGYIQ